MDTKKKIDILPTLLVKSRDVALSRLDILRGHTEWIQIDVIDGKFAANATLDANEFSGVLDDFSVEAQLMVQDPTMAIQEWYQAGVRRIIIHAESRGDLGDHLIAVRKLGLQTGIGIGLDTAISSIFPYIPTVDRVLLMGVPTGFAGGQLHPVVFEKAVELHQRFPDVTIELDGGVHIDIIPKALQSGITSFAVNTALFSAPDPVRMLAAFRDAVVQ